MQILTAAKFHHTKNKTTFAIKGRFTVCLSLSASRGLFSSRFFLFGRRFFSSLTLGFLGQVFLNHRMLHCNRLLFLADFAFETVVQIKAFTATGQSFQITRTAAMRCQNTGNQLWRKLRQSGNQILVDADCKRFEPFEHIVFIVDVFCNHLSLFGFAHGLHCRF